MSTLFRYRVINDISVTHEKFFAAYKHEQAVSDTISNWLSSYLGKGAGFNITFDALNQSIDISLHTFGILATEEDKVIKGIHDTVTWAIGSIEDLPAFDL